VTGSGPVSLAASVWKASGTEPSAWQLTTTDSSGSAVIGPGAVGLIAYLSGSATNAPATITYDNLLVSTKP